MPLPPRLSSLWRNLFRKSQAEVVKDAIYGGLRDKAQPLIYFPIQGGNLLVARDGVRSAARGGNPP
jgi:hypothetical protein